MELMFLITLTRKASKVIKVALPYPEVIGGPTRLHMLSLPAEILVYLLNGSSSPPPLYLFFHPVRSSAESQVKFFPGCSFKGYTNVDTAIAAWDYAVANNKVGVNKYSVPPTTPSRQGENSTNLIPALQPSTPSRRNVVKPSTPSSSMPSAQGSETRLAAIISALNDVDLTSHYVVIRGEKPGVYSNRFVSFLSPTYFSNI